MSTPAELWSRLAELQLVQGGQPLGPRPAPWFVRLMLGIAGWIGALFILAFVGAGFAFVMKSAAAALVLGGFACLGAALLLRAFPRNDFMAQFGFAVSLAGQALVLFGLGSSLNYDIGGVALGMAFFQAMLFVTISSVAHRIWCATTAACALALVLATHGLQAYAAPLAAAACAGLWVKEFEHAARGPMVRASGYGFALTAVMAVMAFNGSTAQWMAETDAVPRAAHAWLGAALGGATLLWAVAALLKREQVRPVSRQGLAFLAGAALLAVISLKAPGVAPLMVIVVVGYANGNRTLTGLGIAALLAYLSFYYYSLEATLLQKSAFMIAAGLSLLIARLVARRLWRADGERHA